MGDEKPQPKAVPGLAESICAALDNAGIGLTVTRDGPDGLKRIYSNDSLAHIMGLDSAEMAATEPLSRVAPDQRDKLARMHQQWRESGSVTQIFQTALSRPDGTRVPVEIGHASNATNEGTTTVSLVRDLSEQARTEEALRASENRFRKLAESAPDTITVAVAGRFVYANPAAARLLGFASPEAMLGEPLSALISEQQLKRLRERLRDVAAGERLPPFIYESKRADGTVFLNEISSTPVMWDGHPAVLAYGRDVTERRRIEAELMQADRMATIGTLAAGIAHEINNPLTYVLLHLQRLQRRLPEFVSSSEHREESERMLAEALEGGERVRSIVKDLLSFTRGPADKQQPLSLRVVVESAIKFARAAHGNSVDIRLRCAPDIPPIVAAEARLGQVFLNIIVNAVQAFGDYPAQDARVDVDVTCDGAQLTTRIEDNGTGITAHALEHIFDPFFTTKPIGRGTGLGLPISRSIVEALGGTLHVENRRTRGVSVCISLPVENDGDHVEPTTVDDPLVASESSSRRRVLVIDDDALVGRAVTSVLADEFNAQLCTDGLAALAALRAELFDVVFCDINMPEPSGVEVYETIVAERPGYAARFVFLTGGAQSQRAAQFIQEHRERVVAKPFGVDLILALARETR